MATPSLIRCRAVDALRAAALPRLAKAVERSDDGLLAVYVTLHDTYNASTGDRIVSCIEHLRLACAEAGLL